MIEIKNQEALGSDLKGILTDLRRGHVSQFPIVAEVAVGGSTVRFTDSRISFGGRWNWQQSLALLQRVQDGKGRMQYIVTSRLIKNEKFAEHSEGYRQRRSIKTAPIAAALREYVRPYSPQEIEMFSDGEIRHARITWADEPYIQTRDMARIDPSDVLQEVGTLTALGVEFTTEPFRKLVAEGLALQEEVRRRKAMKVVDVHVFIQPDGSVMLTPESQRRSDNSSYSPMQYKSLEEAPESVQSTVAMLRITAQPGAYIPEIGRMVNNNIFRVHIPVNDYMGTNA